MKRILSLKVLVIFLLSPFYSFAQLGQVSKILPYYGDDFYLGLKTGDANETLKEGLRKILSSYHTEQTGSADIIDDRCRTDLGKCYNHRPITYPAARLVLMGTLFVEKIEGGYGVRDVYCNITRVSAGGIPMRGSVNIEHTWPQSRFSRRFSADMQKADLHHLFPTDSKINAIRGNSIFGEVTKDLLPLSCPVSRFGLGTAGSEEVFEPPQEHKGHVARALFYFSVRYNLPIDSREEIILRKWNKEVPVDEAELQRNEQIMKIQGTRNPFVDFPELIDKVSDF